MSAVKGVNLLFIIILDVGISTSRNYIKYVLIPTYKMLIEMTAKMPFRPLIADIVMFPLKS